MTDKTQLLEVLPEQSLSFLRAVVDDNEEVKAAEGEEEVGKWDEALVAETFGFELLNEDRVSSTSLTLVETQEMSDANIKDRDADVKANISDDKKKEEPKGEISLQEKQRRAQVEQVLKAPDGMTIKYASHVWDKIRTWVEMTKEEISGMGCVKREKDGSFYVYEVYLLKQDNTSAFTDIDDESLMALMWELQELDEADNGSRYDDLKYWWHSHNNMSTFWSGQDERCIQQKLQHANWWLSTVHNIRNDIATRLDIADPPTRFDELKCELDRVVAPEIEEFCRKEYEEKVTEKSSYTTYSHGSGFPGAYGRYYNGYGGHGHYAGNQTRATTRATTTTQTAKTQVQTTKATGTAGNAGAGPAAKSTRQTTQTQEATQKQTATSLKSMEFASIVNIADVPALVNATPVKARDIYKNEINLGTLYLSERMRSMVIGKVRFIGLAYNPREASNPKDGVEWTISGTVLCGPDKHCYMLVVWNDEPETVALSQIVEMRHRSPQGVLSVARTLSVGDDKFVNMALKCTPENIMFTEEKSSLHVCVGIIFECEEALPAMHLGEDFLVPDDLGIEEDDDIMGEIVDIESVTEEREDNTAPILSNEEYAKEQKEFFDELVAYAEATAPMILENRILKAVAGADRETLTDILGLLACNMAKDADEQTWDEEAEWMTQDQVIDKIEMFIKRDPREAFPFVWNVLPYMYICEECYEPTTKETIQCPNCRRNLPEVKE